MISSNNRARKWFEEQTRQRTIEQMIATLDQVFKNTNKNIFLKFLFKRNAFLNKQNDLYVKTILRQVNIPLIIIKISNYFLRLILFNINYHLINFLYMEIK